MQQIERKKKEKPQINRIPSIQCSFWLSLFTQNSKHKLIHFTFSSFSIELENWLWNILKTRNDFGPVYSIWFFLFTHKIWKCFFSLYNLFCALWASWHRRKKKENTVFILNIRIGFTTRNNCGVKMFYCRCKFCNWASMTTENTALHW